MTTDSTLRLPTIEELTRRGFLGRVGGGCALVASAIAGGCEAAELYSGGGVLAADEPFNLVTHDGLATVPGGMAKVNGKDSTGAKVVVALVRQNQDTVLAFASSCPHMGHPLLKEAGAKWLDDKQTLRCFLHKSEFHADGSVAVGTTPPDWESPTGVHTYSVVFDPKTGEGTVKAG